VTGVQTTNLNGILEQCVKHRRCGCEDDAFHAERRHRRSRVEQVGMIADLTQLHQDVDHAHEVTGCQRLLRSADHPHCITRRFPSCDINTDCVFLHTSVSHKDVWIQTFAFFVSGLYCLGCFLCSIHFTCQNLSQCQNSIL